MSKAWQFIKADQFFPNYCPKVKNYKKKISGRNSKGNPLEFSNEDKKQIRAALKRLCEDCKRNL